MKWTNAINSEMEAMSTYDVFKILPSNAKVPFGHTCISLMMTFDVKPDECHKARFVAGGHVTKDIPHQEAYAFIIHAKNLRLLFLLSAINNQKLVASDVSNAYLNVRTNEKVFSIAGPEFG